MPNSRENMRVMKIFALIILILGLTSCNGTFWGTSYAIMNCSQFVCAYTHHQPATVRQLFDEGRPQHGPLHAGDIVVFGGRHAAVFDGEGLLDSIPERGVGRVEKLNPRDPWYSGPIKVVTFVHKPSPWQ